MNPNDPQMMNNQPVPPAEAAPQDPMAQVMGTLDQLIKAGGASAEDLQNLQMDIQDAIGGDVQSSSEPSGMAGMISKAQGGGY